MHKGLLDSILETLRKGRRKQDTYDSAKFKYTYSVPGLPTPYTHMVVVVKFGWRDTIANNFVLTAYLIEKW
jgi:hypothetical protein